MRRLHPLLTEAKAKAEAYRITETESGFTVWRFRDAVWDRTLAGAPTAETCEHWILVSLGLEPGDNRTLVTATVEEVWDYGWGY